MSRHRGRTNGQIKRYRRNRDLVKKRGLFQRSFCLFLAVLFLFLNFEIPGLFASYLVNILRHRLVENEIPVLLGFIPAMPNVGMESGSNEARVCRSHARKVSYHTVEKEAPKARHNSLLNIEGNVSEEMKDACDRELALLPKDVRNRFVSEGWEFYLMEDTISNRFFHDHNSYMGLTHYDLSSIYVEDRGEAISGAVLHEFGHFLAYNIGIFDRKTDTMNLTWQKLYVKNAYRYPELGIGDYGLTNSVEFFGECFMEYINDPETLKKVLPEVYNEMDFIVKNIK